VLNGKDGKEKMAANISTMTVGDSSMAQQYLDTFRRSEPLEPERALLAAILEDAIHNYRKYGQARDREGKERFREAEEWLMNSANDWIFCFNNVCELLGLDPEYVRSGLRDARYPLEQIEKPGHRRGMPRRAA
jgi:hypothetical protein